MTSSLSPGFHCSSEFPAWGGAHGVQSDNSNITLIIITSACHRSLLEYLRAGSWANTPAKKTRFSETAMYILASLELRSTEELTKPDR